MDIFLWNHPLRFNRQAKESKMNFYAIVAKMLISILVYIREMIDQALDSLHAAYMMANSNRARDDVQLRSAIADFEDFLAECLFVEDDLIVGVVEKHKLQVTNALRYRVNHSLLSSRRSAEDVTDMIMSLMVLTEDELDVDSETAAEFFVEYEEQIQKVLSTTSVKKVSLYHLARVCDWVNSSFFNESHFGGYLFDGYDED